MSPGWVERTLSSELFSSFSKLVLDNQNAVQTSVEGCTTILLNSSSETARVTPEEGDFTPV